jgi:hypothetical protein
MAGLLSGADAGQVVARKAGAGALVSCMYRGSADVSVLGEDIFSQDLSGI